MLCNVQWKETATKMLHIELEISQNDLTLPSLFVNSLVSL